MSRDEAKREQNRLFPHPTKPTQPGSTLPEICLNIRASTDGSADPWPTLHLELTRAMLAGTVGGWEKERGDVIDECINRMCRAAITIIDNELERRVRDQFDY